MKSIKERLVAPVEKPLLAPTPKILNCVWKVPQLYTQLGVTMGNSGTQGLREKAIKPGGIGAFGLWCWNVLTKFDGESWI